jgi:hypothetical protein
MRTGERGEVLLVATATRMRPRSSSRRTRISRSRSVLLRIDTSFFCAVRHDSPPVTTQYLLVRKPCKLVGRSNCLHRSGSLYKTQKYRLWFTESQFLR